jgi:hypothetical protein
MRAIRIAGACLALCLVTSSTATAQTWSLSAQPTLAIGDETRGAPSTPEYQFNRIAHVRRLSDGRILVTMGPDIRYFGADGKYLSKAGGRGQGPGEFQYIQDLYVLPGDTLLALSSRNKVWLTPDGTFVRQELVMLDPLATGGWFSEGAMLLPNGNLLAMQYRQETPENPRPTGLYRPVLRYALLDLRTNRVTPLVTAGGIRQTSDPRGGGTQAFSPHAQHAIGSDRVYVGDNDTTFVSAFTLDGAAVRTFAVADKAVPVTDAHMADYRRRTLEMIGSNAAQRSRFEQNLDAVARPKRFPYWGTAMVDRPGNLWVSAASTGAAGPTTWTVFHRDGGRIASVVVPSGFAPKEIGVDYVLGVMRDDLGVESIHMYVLNRRAR